MQIDRRTPDPRSDAAAQARSAVDEARLVAVLSEFARTMLNDFPIQVILDRLVDRIVTLLPVTAAGVTLISDGVAPRYVAASDESALRYEDLQTELGEGPCLVAFETGQAVAVVDLREDARFPTFGPRAIDAGVVAVFAFPLRHGHGQIGALDLYCDHPGAMGSPDMEAAQTLADVAAAYLINAQARVDLEASSQDMSRLAAIVNSSNDSMASWTADGKIATWNAGSERMYEFSAAEAIGRGVSLIVPPEYVDEISGMHAAVLAGEVVAPIETRRVRRDGTVIDITLMISPLCDRSGAIVGLSDVSRDISDDKRALEALRRSEARKRAVLASTLDAVVTTSQDGIIEEFNPSAERAFGYAEADVIGLELVETIIPPGDRDTYRGGLRRLLGTTDPPVLGIRAEMSMLRSDGSIFPAEVSMTAAAPPGPAVSTTFIRDLTTAKAADGERQRLANQLHQSQRLEMLGQLAGGVAHDFNNLLTVILNDAAFLAETVAGNPDAERAAEQILASVDQASRLTRQLRTFGRRETVRREAIDLNVLVDQLRGVLSTSLGAGVDLVIHGASDLPLVHADKGQAEQILMNLAINARDAMPRGGTLTIETSAVDIDSTYTQLHPTIRPGRYLQLSVSDDGVGMSAETEARAFEPFFTTKAATEGSGLGLATVYGIVSESGGGIDIYSQPGVGTTVKVHLPVTEGVSGIPVPTEAPVISGGNGESILVVEDQEAVRDVTVRLLRRNGYEVVAAGTPIEAIALAGRHHVDLLLTDVVMPEMTGRELADRLRADHGIAAVFMSGYAQGILGPGRALDDGLVLIEKPFSEAAVLEVVHRALQPSPPRSDTPR